MIDSPHINNNDCKNKRLFNANARHSFIILNMMKLLFDNSRKDFRYQSPIPVSSEAYDFFVKYEAIADDGSIVLEQFCKRRAWESGLELMFEDGHLHEEFPGVDDFEDSGEVLFEIKNSK
jgi:hypothetical protein